MRNGRRRAGCGRCIPKGRGGNLGELSEGKVLFESDGLPVRNRAYIVVAGYIGLAVFLLIICYGLDPLQSHLRYAFLVVAGAFIAMALTLLVQTRNIDNVVAFEHGLLIPYHASHLVPAFTKFNRVVPWNDIVGIERRHGLRIILADGRDFLLLLHHDQLDELEQLIRRKLGGK